MFDFYNILILAEPCEIAAADRHHGTTEVSLQQNSLLAPQVEMQSKFIQYYV